MNRAKEGDVKIALVMSEFNGFVTEKLLSGAVARLQQRGVSDANITIEKVPGAVEIPLTAKLLAKTKQYQAIICLGAVIRGETGHYDYVCEQVSQGCQQVMMTFDIPVIFGVLTTDNAEQATARVGGQHGHKGEEAADAALAMIRVTNRLAC